jgi:preprotein translocase subunit SecE
VIASLKTQAKELFDELKRVDWPKKDEVLGTTWTVVLVSAFVGGFLWASDWILSRGFGLILPHQ